MLRTLVVLALGANPGPWGELKVGGAGSYGTGIRLEEYTGAASWQPSAGLTWWVTPSVGLELEYRFIHSELVDDEPQGLNTVNTHRIALTFRIRLG
jgi:hypothetical protein